MRGVVVDEFVGEEGAEVRGVLPHPPGRAEASHDGPVDREVVDLFLGYDHDTHRVERNLAETLLQVAENPGRLLDEDLQVRAVQVEVGR